MLRITKSWLKLVNLPYEVEQPFVWILEVKNVYKDELKTQVNRYDKTDVDFKYPLAIEVMVQGGWNYQVLEYSREIDWIDTLTVAHTKMKEFLLTIRYQDETDDEGKIIEVWALVFTDSEIEIIDL